MIDCVVVAASVAEAELAEGAFVSVLRSDPGVYFWWWCVLCNIGGIVPTSGYYDVLILLQ
jgi:hypothetical protein